MTKLERVLATLDHQPVDRCAVLEQLSYNPRVIADWQLEIECTAPAECRRKQIGRAHV